MQKKKKKKRMTKLNETIVVPLKIINIIKTITHNFELTSILTVHENHLYELWTRETNHYETTIALK